MSPLHLDAFCQWVISKRKVFTCKESFDINLLMEHEEQSSHLMDVIVDQVDNESETTIKYTGQLLLICCLQQVDCAIMWL